MSLMIDNKSWTCGDQSVFQCCRWLIRASFLAYALMVTKKCTKCSEVKPNTEFFRDKKASSGLRSACKPCIRADNAARSMAKGEEYRTNRRRKREASPEAYKQWRDAMREQSLRTKFGITTTEYEARLASQGGVCALCRKPQKTNRLAVDHDHNTGRIRGLLCMNCNTSLGRFENIIPEFLAYLRGT